MGLNCVFLEMLTAELWVCVAQQGGQCRSLGSFAGVAALPFLLCAPNPSRVQEQSRAAAQLNQSRFPAGGELENRPADQLWKWPGRVFRRSPRGTRLSTAAVRALLCLPRLWLCRCRCRSAPPVQFPFCSCPPGLSCAEQLPEGVHCRPVPIPHAGSEPLWAIAVFLVPSEVGALARSWVWRGVNRIH